MSSTLRQPSDELSPSNASATPQTVIHSPGPKSASSSTPTSAQPTFPEAWRDFIGHNPHFREVLQTTSTWLPIGETMMTGNEFTEASKSKSVNLIGVTLSRPGRDGRTYHVCLSKGLKDPPECLSQVAELLDADPEGCGTVEEQKSRQHFLRAICAVANSVACTTSGSLTTDGTPSCRFVAMRPKDYNVTVEGGAVGLQYWPAKRKPGEGWTESDYAMSGKGS